jgi:bacterioferritin-associated ferredoxin
MSSQRDLQKAARKCVVEGCENLRSKAGARGMCGKCYRRNREAGKAAVEQSRALSVHEDPDAPRRKRFEWLGDLQTSLRAFNATEDLENAD